MLVDYKFCPVCTANLVKIEYDYLACSKDRSHFVFYNNPTPVVAAVIEYGEGKILLGHNKAWPPKWYALITGFVEKHEHPEQCVVREVKEETGLDCTIASFIGHYQFNKMNQLIMAYHVIATGKVVLEDELDAVKVLPFEKVKTWPTGTGDALRDFLRTKGLDPEVIQF